MRSKTEPKHIGERLKYVRQSFAFASVSSGKICEHHESTIVHVESWSKAEIFCRLLRNACDYQQLLRKISWGSVACRSTNSTLHNIVVKSNWDSFLTLQKRLATCWKYEKHWRHFTENAFISRNKVLDGTGQKRERKRWSRKCQGAESWRDVVPFQWIDDIRSSRRVCMCVCVCKMNIPGRI